MGSGLSCCCKCSRKQDFFIIHELPHPPYVMPGMGSRLSSDIVERINHGALTVQEVDFCIEANGKNHHSSKFNAMTRSQEKCLVVRRGQPFEMEVLFNQPYNANVHAFSFLFRLADVTSIYGPSDIRSASVPVVTKGSKPVARGAWLATLEGQTTSRVMILVTPPAECIVAPWMFDIDTKIIGDDSSALSYTHPLPIYVLFNPWCENDSVFMSAQDQRQEFVEDDGGLLYRGSYNSIKPSSWSFAQYEKNILECALYLVRHIGQLKGKARSDPIQTARALSAAVNSNDDKGVVWGRWANDDNYPNGTHPVNWVGSLLILQQYYNTKNPVKYGQCWVFAGVLTTICRALGIPCRPVTGFQAAHDRLGSLTIDYFFDAEGNQLNDLTRDLVWNYHVWNEVWMKRPDLGSRYDGWQVIDATPQEKSGGKYRCGPTSLQAVKEGEVDRPYDATFVFAQVNADQVYWKHSGKIQPLKLLSRNTDIIGQFISTKAVGQMQREDLTSLYKYPEFTKKERDIFEKALRRSPNNYARYYLNDAFNEITFTLVLKDDVMIGQDFSVDLVMRSYASVESHQVKGVLTVHTTTHTGEEHEKVKSLDFDLNVGPGRVEVVTIVVLFDDYYTKLVDQASFKVTCMAKIVKIDFDYFAQDTFRVRNPDIIIRTETKPILRQKLKATALLKNPLPIQVRNPKFYIQGPGLEKQLKFKLKKKLAPGAVFEVKFEVIPTWAGRHQITAKFCSKGLTDVDGYISFVVKESKLK